MAEHITKGTRIRASWFSVTNPPSMLAGVQMKFGVNKIDLTGVCVHFRSDKTDGTGTVMVYIDPDPGQPEVKRVVPVGCQHPDGHVEIKPDWIVGIVD